MYTCMAEYKIAQEYREKYLHYVEGLLRGEKAVQVYEGTNQPNLFVEVWHAATEAEALQVQEERCGERSSWSAITAWIPGGVSKLHVWTFRRINAQ
ncbi:hypothetical protein ACFO9Q_01990 [Paenibacillus sp. GCM10023252]|uniref:hypothetical protein n=1 Tax=Paenibacillus sp. GCM10023252 TaxID=3252649 RepID=UPI00361B6414